MARTINLGASVESKLKDFAAKIGGGSVSVGFLSGATYPNGTPVAAVAFWNEFGHGGRFPAPARPFFRTMIAKNSSQWGPNLGHALVATRGDGQKALALMGEEIDGELKQSIVDFASPADSPTTLRLREVFGNSPENIRARDVLQAQRDVASGEKVASGTQAHPLIWTGHMLDSTGYRVETNR